MQQRSNSTLRGQWGLIGAAYAFLIIMMGTTLPTPLYPIYSEEFNLSPLVITIIYAVYAGGVIFGLLVFGQLSDRIGAPLCTTTWRDTFNYQRVSLFIRNKFNIIAHWTYHFWAFCRSFHKYGNSNDSESCAR